MNMFKFSRKILVFSIVILITCLFLIYIQPYLYKVLPSDFKRHLALENYFKQDVETDKGEIIIFGGSDTMFGIDSRIIRDNLNLSGEAYNLSTVAQTPYEASYYYTRIKNNTKIVIQCTSPVFVSKDMEYDILNEPAISMYLSGYRISDATKEFLPNYNDLFDKPELFNLFYCRSYCKSYIHNLIKPLFDNEISENKELDIYFPNPYPLNKHPNYPVYEYDCNYYKFKNEPITQMNFIKKSAKYFKNRNIKYVFVLMPVNPDNCSECYDDFIKYEKQLRQIDDIYVINILNLIEPKYFYDGYHANREGAKIISAEISRQLKLMQLN